MLYYNTQALYYSMDLTKYNGKGYVGLVNLGNTCFLNSCLQVLNHTYELNEFFASKKYESHLKTVPDSSIIKEWVELQTVLWTNNGTVSPNKFVYHVHKIAQEKGREIFTGWAQNDMPEFLLFMIECMHNALSRPINMRILGNVENEKDKMATECYAMLKREYSKEFSEIMQMFYGIYVSELTSLNGNVTHAVKPESFFMLDLPISQDSNTLESCMDEFTKNEVLEGENAWLNEATGQKENIKKRITFWNFPNILVIALKRFSPCGEYKMNNQIQFPIQDLNLSKYVSGYHPNKYVYDLYGICNHMGGIHGGHYTAYVKNSEEKWIHYNDTNVDIVQDPCSMITPSAYCLFYRKKNNVL